MSPLTNNGGRVAWRRLSSVLFLMMAVQVLYGQTKTPGEKPDLLNVVPKRQLIILEHVAFATDNLELSPLENTIAHLESKECKAILKRDTTTLREIWTRDFTANESTDKVVAGRSSLPYYIALSRTVEKFSVIDEMVLTSGYEVYQILLPDGDPGEIGKRSFSHTWIKKNGVWKLTVKTNGK